MVQGLKDMLDRNISFSLYMTHGGTTFGHWGGANNPAYSAMCSSYDYDAPISEAGWATEKYFLLRDLLKGYLPAGQSLPTIPGSSAGNGNSRDQIHAGGSFIQQSARSKTGNRYSADGTIRSGLGKYPLPHCFATM